MCYVLRRGRKVLLKSVKPGKDYDNDYNDSGDDKTEVKKIKTTEEVYKFYSRFKAEMTQNHQHCD